MLDIALHGASQQEVTVALSTVFTIKEDLQRLMEVQSGERAYAKGAIGTYAEDSPFHRLGFKFKHGEGPQ